MGSTTEVGVQKGATSAPAPPAETVPTDGATSERRIAGKTVPPDVSGGHGPAMSARMKEYFDGIRREVERCYVVGKAARAKGLDPALDVEILPAEDLAARVEAQVEVKGVAEDVRRVTKEIGNRELVSLEVARRVAAGRYVPFKSKEEAVDKAVRTGLSILTEGVLVAPLEGIAEVKIGKNDDGTDYVDLYFAGPIRAAGGTAQAMSVLIADVVRRELGIGTYKVTTAELERYKEEVPAYKQAANLQYTPGPKEIEAIVKHCPICINGEGTERVEIAGNRDLPRVPTNQIRGGAMLVLCEGMCLKAPKIQKHVQKLGLEGWGFLDGLVDKKDDKKEEEQDQDPDALPVIAPSSKYIRDIIAGRPVFGYPGRAGGFRLRYGRARTAGLASTALHPAVMPLVDDFIAIGTQLKIERPGKGTIGSPCPEVDPPSVELRNGDLVRLDTVKAVLHARPFVHAILDLGELLVPFGEFVENNHRLARSPWVHEWFRHEVEAHVAEHGWPEAVPRAAAVLRRDSQGTLDPSEAFAVAAATGLPLAPSQTLFWHDIEPAELKALSDHVAAHLQEVRWSEPGPKRAEEGCPEPLAEGKTLVFPAADAVKGILRKLTFHHRDLGDRYEATFHGYALLRGLGFDLDGDQVVETARRGLIHEIPTDLPRDYATVDLAARLSGVVLRPRGPFRIGARMGRPEKADARKMKPPPHVLFPLGKSGGTQRLVGDAAQYVDPDIRQDGKTGAAGRIIVEVGKRRCTQCGEFTYRTFCEMCYAHTTEATEEPEEVTLDLKGELKRAQEALGMRRLPAQIKGVVGMISRHKTPEPLEKGLLRAKHGVYTFKDGTARFDMSDGPLTHFRPAEVAVTVERLRALGYTHDMHGRPLERDDQVLELRVQDIVVPEACGQYLLACATYVDELLVQFYKMEPFYKAETRDDLVGHIVGGLAPHTSGAIAARIVGYTPSQVGWGHPYFHAGKRRNCVVGGTDVFTVDSPAVVRQAIEDLWQAARPTQEGPDAAGTDVRVVDRAVLAMDSVTGRIRPQKIAKVMRAPAPRHLVQITTKSGRSMTVTPGHRMVVLGDGRPSKRRAMELRVGDRVPFARHVDLETAADTHIDLLAHWTGDRPHDLMVRGIGAWLRQSISALGGLAAATKACNMPSKALDNYRRRDSVPLEAVLAICAARHVDPVADVPADARLGARRDTVTVPRIVAFTPEFLRLVGYYLAEGFSRSRPGSAHQVDIAASEAEIQRDVVHCARTALGLEVKAAPTRVTLSGRLVYLLFNEVLRAGTRAGEKRIPVRLSALPLESARQLLAAYFAGDGSVERGRLHVTTTSISLGLLRDVGLQLSRWGIAYRLRRDSRQGGGAVADHYARKGQETPFFESWRLSIRSSDAVRFAEEVGFSLERKQGLLVQAIPSEGTPPLRAALGDLVEDEVVAVEHKASGSEWVYDLEVEQDHTYVCNENMVTSNCDGDEDAVFLLMDGLLNFSKSYVPDRRGGLMDLPLVLTTRLDPAEIDKEAHNVDTLDVYPRAFYEATTRHAHPKEVESVMGLVGERVGTPLQYEGFGYTHDAPDISEGVLVSAYKIIPDMMAKLFAQLDLASRITAVDMKDVASRVIGSHFMPDLIGNLKAFSKQKVRCPACNQKYRRFPLTGRCLTPNCKGKLTLTVHEGSVRKYLQPAKDISRKYAISHYTLQRILLAEKSIESLFNNDKVRKAKLTDFLKEET